MAQDGGGLAELEEEGGLAGEDLVAGADAREYAVDGAEAAAGGRHVAALVKGGKAAFNGEWGNSQCTLHSVIHWIPLYSGFRYILDFTIHWITIYKCFH